MKKVKLLTLLCLFLAPFIGLSANNLNFSIKLFDAESGQAINTNTNQVNGLLFIHNPNDYEVKLVNFQPYSLQFSRVRMGLWSWFSWLLDTSPVYPNTIIIRAYSTEIIALDSGTAIRSGGYHLEDANHNLRIEPGFSNEMYHVKLRLLSDTFSSSDRTVYVQDVIEVHRMEAPVQEPLELSATSSSQFSSNYAPDNLIDGNLNSFWVGASNQKSYTIEIGLNRPAHINKLQINWYNRTYSGSNFDVSTSVDGQIFEPIASGLNFVETIAIDKTVKVVKIQINETYHDFPVIREIKLEGI